MTGPYYIRIQLVAQDELDEVLLAQNDTRFLTQEHALTAFDVGAGKVFDALKQLEPDN